MIKCSGILILAGCTVERPDDDSAGRTTIVTEVITVVLPDSSAAEQLWLATEPDAVDTVLAEEQGGTLVNREVLHPEFSFFGQTAWTVADQSTFAAQLPCIAGVDAVLTDMSAIDPSQAWGLGSLTGFRFKGGWGPDHAGMYSARQFRLVPTAEGQVVVAIITTPGSGAFADATAMATTIA